MAVVFIILLSILLSPLVGGRDEVADSVEDDDCTGFTGRNVTGRWTCMHGIIPYVI